jgi:hypothetical protein
MIGMADEQRQRYEEYKKEAAKLVRIAQRRPLMKEEFELLQKLLACMRMLCDTPFILDPACRISPKLDELERVLSELLADPERKVIVFSEWERVLSLVRELAEDMGIEFAWHTGSVPQLRRRAEIARFKRDPSCRLFLSTDSGGVGLNLQAASAGINLDLPWNPAKLEQRIARAWRKNQQRTVDVINLVTENSIEHAMLHVLSQKQALADGVLDGEGGLKETKLRSGRRAFIERMAALMEPPAAPEPPQSLRDTLVERHGDRLLLLESYRAADGAETLLAVLSEADGAAAERARLSGMEGPRIEVLDREAYEAVQRLASAGLVHAAPTERPELYRSPRLAAAVSEPEQQRMAKGAELLGGAERKLRMALLLAQGGFATEALPALTECMALADSARQLMAGSTPDGAASEQPVIASPAAMPRSLDEIAGSIERLLGDIRHGVNAARAA